MAASKGGGGSGAGVGSGAWAAGGRGGGGGNGPASLETLLYELARRGQVTVSSLGQGGALRWVVTVIDAPGHGRAPDMRHYDGPDLFRTVRAAHAGAAQGSVP